jgi:hypothetical protein
MLRWNQYAFHKKCVGTRYAELVFLHPVRSAGHVVHSGGPRREMSQTYFHARVGPVRFAQKGHLDTLHQTCVFASGAICASHSVSMA